MERKIICQKDAEIAKVILNSKKGADEHIRVVKGIAVRNYKCDVCTDAIATGTICHAITIYSPQRPYVPWENDYIKDLQEIIIDGKEIPPVVFQDDDPEITDIYSRKEAVEDGQQVLIPAAICKDQGVIVPVYVTDTIINIMDKEIAENKLLSYEGIFTDILFIFRTYVAAHTMDDSTIKFTVKIGKKDYEIFAQIGPEDIDNPAPAITIMGEFDL